MPPGDYLIGVNHPAIVREIPHFGLFPAFPHFLQNIPHFRRYFEITKIAENRNNFAVRRHFVPKISVKDVTECHLAINVTFDSKIRQKSQ